MISVKQLFVCTVIICSPSNATWKSYTSEILSEPSPPSCKRTDKFENNWIVQFADHFADLDPTVLRLRYYSNLQYFVYGGPMFVIIGGPWEISPHFVCTGLVVDAVRSTNGAVFYIEHRFYGQSHPAKMSAKDDLLLLTRAQAIEDIRFFIEHQKTHTLGLSHSNVVLIGSHLAGSLAAYVQFKYPTMISGVWATGAPFRPSEIIPNFLDNIRQFIRSAGGEQCLKRVDQTFATIKRDWDATNTTEYTTIFNMCPGFDFANLYDQSTFFYHLSNIITRAFFYNDQAYVKEELCYNFMDFEYLDEVEAFAAHYLDHQRGRSPPCVNFSFKYFLRNIGNRNGFMDAWAYQSCYEYGWLPSGPDGFESLWLPRSFFQAMCYNLYSILDEHRKQALNETGHLLVGIVNGAANIILTYASDDPWTSAGIGDMKRGEDRILMFMKGESFDSNIMSSVNRSDSMEIQQAKMVVLNRLQKWAEKKASIIEYNHAPAFGVLPWSVIAVAVIVVWK